MGAATRILASASVGGLLVVSVPVVAQAQAERSPVTPLAYDGAVAQGTLTGTVLDERGLPVAGAAVTAVGKSARTALTDKKGRYEFGALPPGPYQVRVHLTGYTAPSPKTI